MLLSLILIACASLEAEWVRSHHFSWAWLRGTRRAALPCGPVRHPDFKWAVLHWDSASAGTLMEGNSQRLITARSGAQDTHLGWTKNAGS